MISHAITPCMYYIISSYATDLVSIEGWGLTSERGRCFTWGCVCGRVNVTAGVAGALSSSE